MKKFIYAIVIIGLIAINFGVSLVAAPDSAIAKKVTNVAATVAPIKPSEQSVLNVSPLSLVKNPEIYLNKTVTFSGEFVSFTSLGLDYKPAFRDGTKYIGILMKRPDVKAHTIPLSELKMLMTREMAEKNTDIETGDKFKLTGKVFSTALGDPWLDVTEFTITTPKKKVEKSKTDENTNESDKNEKSEKKE